MSTIKVNKIEHTGTTAGGVEVDSSGHVTVDGVQMPTAGALSNRNLIINGAMRVAQRGTSETGLTNGNSGYHTVDRFYWLEQGSPTYVQTMSQSTDAPAGFSNSLKLETTTADAAYTSTEANAITYRFEGQDLQSLAYGTASAKSFTLSFWVKSSVTGTYVIWLYNVDQTKSCTQSYTIDTANTWEYKTITVAGDTSSGFDNDNGGSLYIRWILGAGPDFTSGTASTTWISGITNANRYVGQAANIPGAVGNTWQITGVQLEVGAKSTSFEHRSYGDELDRCQRYFQDFTSVNSKIRGARYNSNSGVDQTAYLPVRMRAQPNVTIVSSSDGGANSSLQVDARAEEKIVFEANPTSSNTGVFMEFTFTCEAEL